MCNQLRNLRQGKMSSHEIKEWDYAVLLHIIANYHSLENVHALNPFDAHLISESAKLIALEQLLISRFSSLALTVTRILARR